MIESDIVHVVGRVVSDIQSDKAKGGVGIVEFIFMSSLGGGGGPCSAASSTGRCQYEIAIMP